MFEKQIHALRVKIAAAEKLRNHSRAITEYTNIIDEKLDNKSGVDIQAILFLDNNKIAELYTNRALAYERIASSSKARGHLDDTVEYYRLASLDTHAALKFFEDLDEIYECRRQLREDAENIASALNELKGQTQDKKRTRASDADDKETRPTKRYTLRKGGMWVNPKETHEKQMDALNEQQSARYGRRVG